MPINFLNIDKSNFVIFHPYQKRITPDIALTIAHVNLKHGSYNCIKYLGLYIDSNLGWKNHVDYICKKVKSSVGILSKLRHFVTIDILKTMYYTLIYPFLIYGIIVWGNTYQTTLNSLYILQKQAVRIITFANFDDHSSPIFKGLNFIKLFDLVTLHIAIFMHKFHHHHLPSVFDNFFIDINRVHNYNTRLAAKQSYYIPKVRTNFGKFNIRFQGPTVWNSIKKDIKICSTGSFKYKMKQNLLNLY